MRCDLCDTVVCSYLSMDPEEELLRALLGQPYVGSFELRSQEDDSRLGELMQRYRTPHFTQYLVEAS